VTTDENCSDNELATITSEFQSKNVGILVGVLEDNFLRLKLSRCRRSFAATLAALPSISENPFPRFCVPQRYSFMPHQKLLRLVAVFLLSLSGLITARHVAAEINAPAPQNQTDPLVTLNNAFRGEYSRAKTEALSKLGPLIIVEGAKAVLVRNGKRTESEIQPPIYQALKAVAHIPFAVFLMFDQSDFKELTDERVAQLRDYRKLIVDARSSLGDRGFSETQLQRQQKIIDNSLLLLDAAIENRQVQKTALDEFARQMAPVLLENVDEAAKVELDALHSHVTEWRHRMTPDEWKTLHVVVMVAHMPRDEELTVQYFQRLFDDPIEGHRIICAEGLWEEPRALELLATHLIDGAAGVAFFGEYMRMHRDLLADAARAYIQNSLLKSEPKGAER
jgi:hypothetical protein